MSEDKGDWTWWNDALKGITRLEGIAEGDARCGYYRQRYHAKPSGALIDRPVAIWKENGQFVAKRGTAETAIDIRDQHKIGDLFMSVCGRPVSYDAYLSAFEGRGWPGDLPEEATPQRGPGDNSKMADPYELAIEEARTLRQSYDKLVAAIGENEPTKDQADQLGEYAAKWQALWTKFEDTRKEEKEPFLEGGRKVDAKWRDILAGCTTLKAAAKKLAERFLIAENRRREEAAAEARRLAEEERRRQEEERRRQEELARRNPFGGSAPPADPGPPPPRDPEPVVEAVKPKLQTSGRSISLTTVKKVEILNIEQVKAAFIASPAGEEAARAWVEKVGANAPFPIPGTRQFTQQVAR